MTTGREHGTAHKTPLQEIDMSLFLQLGTTSTALNDVFHRMLLTTAFLHFYTPPPMDWISLPYMPISHGRADRYIEV